MHCVGFVHFVYSIVGCVGCVHCEQYCRLFAVCVEYRRLCRLAGAGRWWDHGTSCVQYCTVRGTMAPGKERKLGRTEARTLSVFLLRSPRMDSTTVPQFVDILVGFDDCRTISTRSMIDTKRKDSKQFYLQHTLCSYVFLHYVLFQHSGLPPSPPIRKRFRFGFQNCLKISLSTIPMYP